MISDSPQNQDYTGLQLQVLLIQQKAHSRIPDYHRGLSLQSFSLK